MNTNTPVSSKDTFHPTPVSGIRTVQLARARIQVHGLSSAFDAARLERRLDRQVGVLGVHVNPVNDHAQIAYDPGLTSPSTLAKQIEFSGYRATVR